MFERYREDARRAIFFARWEAQQSGSAYIQPKHILLGLTHDADSKANQLFALAAFAEQFRRHLKLPIRPEQVPKGKDLPLSNAGKRVLVYTAEEADKMFSTPIGTEHLLLGLLREKKSEVPEVLATAGIDLQSARNRIRQEIHLPLLDPEPESAAATGKTLRPFAAFLLLILVLVLIYLVVRLVIP
jgi:ATP-dependent Clp protease ATP-binding subunit ClpC